MICVTVGDDDAAGRISDYLSHISEMSTLTATNAHGGHIMDIFAKCRSYQTARMAMEDGVYPYFLRFENHEGTTAILAGREIIMCGSNNYLGLTTDRRVVDASAAAIEKYGSSCTGSRLLNGNFAMHEDLEGLLAETFGKQSALVFSTGYHANVGAISALLSRGDVAFVDREAHASAIDGCAMSGAQIKFFKHNDASDLRSHIKRAAPAGGSLVIVDGVYSMGGDLCRLDEITAVCNEFGLRLLVDDAHGAGVLAGGRGTCAKLELTDKVDLISITFSKAYASIGGAVIGDASIIHYLRHHARTQIFSAGMTPASTAAALTAVQIARTEPERGEQALANAQYVADKLSALGFEVGASQSPIVPVHIGDAPGTLVFWRRLLDLGVYTNAILPPAATPRLRTSFMATHDRRQLDRVVEAFETARKSATSTEEFAA